MAVATLFDDDGLSTQTSRQINGKKETLLSLLTGGRAAREEEMPELERTPAPTPPRRLGLHEYLRGLDMMIRTTERAQINHTLVNVSPAEIQGLIEKTAKAKARYLAAVLDAAAGDALPDAAATKALEAARERHEELDTGLRALLDEVRQGNVTVDGIGGGDGELGTENAGAARNGQSG